MLSFNPIEQMTKGMCVSLGIMVEYMQVHNIPKFRKRVTLIVVSSVSKSIAELIMYVASIHM